MKNKHIFTITGTIYPYDTVFGIGVSPEEIIKWMEDKYKNPFTEDDKQEICNIEKTTRGRVVRCQNNSFVVWVRHVPKSPEWHGVLSHELFHLVTMLLTKIGCNLTDDSDEAYAHLIDWYTKEVYTKLSTEKPLQKK